MFTADGSAEQTAAARAADEQAQKLMEDQRDTAQMLAASVAKLQTAVGEGQENTKMIESLKMCVLTLGQIKTRFVHLKMFWQNVAEHARHLVTLKDDLVDCIDADMICMLEESYIESGKGWACLGLVSLEANKALVATQGKVDAFMSALPSGDAKDEEVKEMLKKLEINMQEAEKDAEKMIQDFQDNKAKQEEAAAALA